MSKNTSAQSPALPPHPTPDEARALVARIAARLRISKVVVTRSLKGSKGDGYVGFSAGWDTLQDDGGGGPVAESAAPANALTLKEASIAAIILGRNVEVAAYRNARASNNLPSTYCEAAIKAVSHNYGQLLAEVLGEVPPPAGDPNP